MDVNQLKAIYFIGAGGIGMSALVRYFLSTGKKVGGYDRTPSQLTDKLVEGKDDDMDIYREIFKWITTNINYASGYVDNDPYPVFQTKQAICQGTLPDTPLC